MDTTLSKQLFNEASRYIPGGVNSPVRAFKSVGGNPLFIKSGKGSKIYDVDGQEFIDYVGSWGPHIFGHNPDFIKKALLDTIENGTSFGAPTELELKMAKLIVELVPSVEMVRMVNSGTEATMSAVRAARGYTRRDKIIKFEGCYHGHADYFLIKAGSGALTLGSPDSPGVTKANAADTLVATYNDINSVKQLIKENKKEIAAVIIEPIAGNVGVLIFDEVMTGFRVSAGGAQKLLGIKPDLSTFGKIIGGGLPVGAFGGKREIMEMISPHGPVYQAGTLSGNPLAMSAGYAALSHIKNNPDIYDQLEDKSKYLENGFKENLKMLNKKFALNRVGSMMSLFFTEKEVNDYKSATTSDTILFGKYFLSMLMKGVYLAPSQYEASFVSTAHTIEDLNYTIKAQFDSLSKLLK
jgi:glutamate-1-semialdehyde 2,1-aminomutase